MQDFDMKYNKEFREKYPETVGETDHVFDTSNYAEFLESMLEEALNNAPKNTIHNSDYAKLPKFDEVYKKAYELDRDKMTVATFYECLKELGNFA